MEGIFWSCTVSLFPSVKHLVCQVDESSKAPVIHSWAKLFGMLFINSISVEHDIYTTRGTEYYAFRYSMVVSLTLSNGNVASYSVLTHNVHNAFHRWVSYIIRSFSCIGFLLLLYKILCRAIALFTHPKRYPGYEIGPKSVPAKSNQCYSFGDRVPVIYPTGTRFSNALQWMGFLPDP